MVRVEEAWARLGLGGHDLDLERLERYAGELERWNRAIRLVGPRDLPGIRAQVADALVPFLRWPPTFPLLDIGSGAGLPGIAVAAAWRGAPVVCLEAQGKRVSFLRHAVRTLELRAVRVVEGRAEEALRLAPDLEGAFATVTARAVAEPRAFLPMARPFLAEGGRAMLLRASPGAPEVEGWAVELEAGYEGPGEMGPRSVAIYARARPEGQRG